MTKIIILLCAVLLTGCNDPMYQPLEASVLPEELKDCKFYDVRINDGSLLTIVRCPNATTSTNYRQGKAKRVTVVKDGE